MRLISLKINSLNDVFVQQLRDIYDAENRLVDALPKMAGAASNQQLRAAFEDHLRETKEHVVRLARIFSAMGEDATGETCEAMKGLVSEGSDYVNAEGDPEARDAGLIAAAQKVEHYEIAVYGTLRTLARRLGHEAAASVLQQTLDEEGATDKKLTAIAERFTNVAAQQHSA